MRLLINVVSFFFAFVGVANAEVTVKVPDGSTVVVNGVPVTPPPDGGGGGENPPPDGGGGGENPPPDGGGGGNTACIEGLHAEKMVINADTWTYGGALGVTPMKNGAIVGGGGSLYVCHNGQLLSRGDDTQYYVYNGSGWILKSPSDPTTGKTWPLIGVTGTSPNNTHGFEATDSYGHKWTFCNTTKVCRDGQMTGGDGTEMLFWNNGIYILGGDNSWYVWTGATFWPFSNQDPSTITPTPTFGPVQPPPSGSAPPSGGGGNQGSNLPVPNPPSVLPGSNGHIITVAAGANISNALATAQPGDTVELAAGGYTESFTIPNSVLVKGKWTQNAVKNRSTGTWIDCTQIHGSNLAGHGKGCIVLKSGAKIQGVEVYGAGMTETASGGTAGIRPDADGYVYVDNVFAHDNQDGLFGGGYSNAWEITNVLLDHNGLGDGLSHNLYITAGKVTISHMVSTNPNNGHAFKLRGQESTISDSLVDGGQHGSSLDYPDGGRHTLTNVTINKPAGAPVHNVIFYSEESQKYGIAGLTANGGQVNALCANPHIVTTGPITFSNTTVTGNPITVSGGGTVTGLPGQRASNPTKH